MDQWGEKNSVNKEKKATLKNYFFVCSVHTEILITKKVYVYNGFFRFGLLIKPKYKK